MRSAVAHALLAARLHDAGASDITVLSAGTHADPDRPADPRMCAAAAALGVPLDSHRATLLSRAMVAAADIVFVMDYLNEASVLATYPLASRKVRLLGSYALSKLTGAEIPDPFTEEDAASHRCAARIAACVEALVATLETTRQATGRVGGKPHAPADQVFAR